MQELYRCTLGQKNSTVYSITSIEEIVHHSEQKVLYVCDNHTRRYVPQGVAVLELPAGEIAKTYNNVEKIIGKALELSLARDSKFIAVGGGVICDITAFAASIYMRGCAVSLVPTTLLSMVDASLGGKTAIDALGAKNLVGTFYPAQEIFLCTDTLKTLSDAEYKNGLGEVLKHALLSDDTALLEFLQKHRSAIRMRQPDVLEKLIQDSLQVKRSYIERDPTEQKGIRDALNLGHTFAHALESIGNMITWSHGEAVAWGVMKALQAGKALGITPSDFAQQYEELFSSYEFDSSIQITDTDAFIAALQSDKKRRQSQIRFVLMQGQGKHTLQALTEDVIRNVISL